MNSITNRILKFVILTILTCLTCWILVYIYADLYPKEVTPPENPEIKRIQNEAPGGLIRPDQQKLIDKLVENQERQLDFDYTNGGLKKYMLDIQQENHWIYVCPWFILVFYLVKQTFDAIVVEITTLSLFLVHLVIPSELLFVTIILCINWIRANKLNFLNR